MTDNHAMTFLESCRILNSRLTRWILAIQDYHFEIELCKEIENTVADALSRIEHQDNKTSSDPEFRPDLLVAIFEKIPDPKLVNHLENLMQHQKEGEHLQMPYEALKNGPQSLQYKKYHLYYRLHEDILFRKHNNQWQICVPTQIIDLLVFGCHGFYTHCGSKKWFTILQESFIFKNMRRHICALIRTCDTCQRSKTSNQPLHGLVSGIKCKGNNEHLQ